MLTSSSSPGQTVSSQPVHHVCVAFGFITTFSGEIRTPALTETNKLI